MDVIAVVGIGGLVVVAATGDAMRGSSSVTKSIVVAHKVTKMENNTRVFRPVADSGFGWMLCLREDARRPVGGETTPILVW